MSGAAGWPQGATVAPRALIALRPLALAPHTGAPLAAMPGGFATRAKGAGLEVADLREYRAGDDLRHLDRSATARTGKLHVKQFAQERDRVTLLIADFRAEMVWGLRRAFRSVAAAEALSVIGWQVVEAGGRVALLALGPTGLTVVPPRPRVPGMLDVIRGLCEAHGAALEACASGAEAAQTGLAPALVRAERLVPRGSDLVIASGFDGAGAGLADTLASLARRRHLSLILITAGQGLPAGSFPVRMHDGRRLRLRLGGAAQRATTAEVAGRSALVIDADDPVDVSAARLVAAQRPARAA